MLPVCAGGKCALRKSWSKGCRRQSGDRAERQLLIWPDWAGLTALEKAITEHGYQYLGELKDTLADPIEAARAAELKDLKLKVTCGAIFSVIIFFGSMQHWFSFLQGIPRQSCFMLCLS